MLLRRRLSHAFMLVAAFGLAGCAAPVPRSADGDSQYKSVAIVSILQEQSKVTRMGATVFNNKTVMVDHGGALNRIAGEIVERHVRASRPQWAMRTATIDVAALASKQANGVPLTTFTGNIRDDLRRIAQESDADMMFVIIDRHAENRAGRGVGVVVQNVTHKGMQAYVHGHVMVVLVDRTGKELDRRGGSVGRFVAPAEVGLDSDATLEPATKAMRTELADGIEGAVTAMGY